MDTNLRTAGRAALAAAGFYVAQPVVVALRAGDDLFVDPAEVRAQWLGGALEGAIFFAVGFALLVLVVAGSEAVCARTGGGSVRTRVCRALGVLGAAGWMLAAGLSVAGTSTVAAALAQTGAESAAQEAALHVVNIGITACLVLTAVTFGAWLVLFSQEVGRVGIVGRVLALAGMVVGVVAAASAAYGFPVGLLLTIPYLVALGMVLVRSARMPVVAARAFSAA